MKTYLTELTGKRPFLLECALAGLRQVAEQHHQVPHQLRALRAHGPRQRADGLRVRALRGTGAGEAARAGTGAGQPVGPVAVAERHLRAGNLKTSSGEQRG